MTTEQPGASPALSDQLGPLPKRLRECADEVMEFPHPSACDHLHTAHALMRHAADVVERLRIALRFYAGGHHYNTDDDEEFDTVSGEPQNWLCSGLDDSATMIEDGGVARLALRGINADWTDGNDDFAPEPIEGEEA